MKKYLVDVYLPSIGAHYDTYLPAGKRISETTGLLVRIAEHLSSGGYMGTPDAMLLDAETGSPIPPDLTVYDAGIRNAHHLILV